MAAEGAGGSERVLHVFFKFRIPKSKYKSDPVSKNLRIPRIL